MARSSSVPDAVSEALVGKSPSEQQARLNDARDRRLRVNASRASTGKLIKTYGWVTDVGPLRSRINDEWWDNDRCVISADLSQLLYEGDDIKALRKKYPSPDRARHALPTHETIYELGIRVINLTPGVDRAEQERVASILRKYFPPRIDRLTITKRRIIKKARTTKPSTQPATRQETLW